MKERPILFSGEMVRAILDGRKTQTRRVMKVQPSSPDMTLATIVSTTGPKKDEEKSHWVRMDANGYSIEHDDGVMFSCPYGKPGDRLWVREKFKAQGHCTYGIHYSADKFTRNDKRACVYGDDYPRRWRPSIHMPRWASRITLEITGIRVERLQDISDEDAMHEGVYADLPANSRPPYLPSEAFMLLWDSINGKPRKDGVDISWASNPWVWAVAFKQLKGSGV